MFIAFIEVLCISINSWVLDIHGVLYILISSWVFDTHRDILSQYHSLSFLALNETPYSSCGENNIKSLVDGSNPGPSEALTN